MEGGRNRDHSRADPQVQQREPLVCRKVPEHPRSVRVQLMLSVLHDPSTTQLPRAFPGGLLRRLRTSDLAAFQAYRSIPELGRFQGWSPMSEAEALSFLAEMSETRLFTAGDWVQLGIADPEDGH